MTIFSAKLLMTHRICKDTMEKKNRISENRVKKIDDIGVKDRGFVLFEEIKSFFIVISKARIDPPCLFNKSVHSLLSTKKTFHLFVCPAYSMITFKD